MPRIFPEVDKPENLVIGLSGNGAKEFTCLVSTAMPDIQVQFNGQWFPLYLYDKSEDDEIEVGIDEAGRGPLIGRVYVAGVILPKEFPDDTYLQIKDSKKLSKELKDKNIVCSLRNGRLRVSIAHYNSQEDIDVLLAVLL